MHYVIFPDTLFLENLICDLCFLSFMKMLFFLTPREKEFFLPQSWARSAIRLFPYCFFDAHCFFGLRA